MFLEAKKVGRPTHTYYVAEHCILFQSDYMLMATKTIITFSIDKSTLDTN